MDVGLLPLISLLVNAAQLGVLFWFARYFLRIVTAGDWVPKRELDYNRLNYERSLADKDSQIAEWRAAHDTSERAREILSSQSRDLLDTLRNTERFYDSFRATVLERRDREEGDGGARSPG